MQDQTKYKPEEFAGGEYTEMKQGRNMDLE